MFERLFRSSRVRQRIARSVLAGGLRDLAAYLHTRGYRVNTVHAYVQACEHFGQWLRERRLPVRRVTPTTARAFIIGHLPVCTCPTPCNRSVATVRAGLRHLLDVLRATGRLAEKRAAAPGAIDRVLADYEAYLSGTCGAAAATRHYYVRNVRELLVAKFGRGRLDLHRLRPSDIIRFIASRAARLSPGSSKTVTTSLRSFLRFLQLTGVCDASLIAAVPAIPQWRLAPLPEVLTDEQLRAVRSSFDLSKPSGLRDRAIVLCLAELGLRAPEVAALSLDDIDWRGGTIVVAPGKSRRADRLPLPASIARALVAYVRRGRPQTSVRSLFVRHRAPFAEPITPGIVRGVVRRAYARSAVCAGLTRAYLLRHTAATRLLRAGATLKDVADLLRHRSFNTTAIYAKVDVQSLAGVALPWPEVR